MYICNTARISKALEVPKILEGKSIVPVVIGDYDETVQGGFILQDDMLKIVPHRESVEDNFLLQGISMLNKENLEDTYRVSRGKGKRKTDITYKMIQDTEENPLIAIICKEIEVFQDVEADLRIIDASDDYIFAMLVSGSCVFDGVAMQRCDDSNLAGKETYKYSAKRLSDMISHLFTDKDTDYCYSKDIMAGIVLKHTSDTDLSCSRVSVSWLDDTKHKMYRDKWEEREKAKAERLEHEKAEREARALEAKRRKEEEEQEMAEQLKAGKTVGRKNMPTGGKEMPASLGAADFMRFIQQQNKGK